MKLIVLAAGKGSRLNSETHELPKVLRQAEGRALIDYVVDAASFIEKKDIHIVVGFKHELVVEHLGSAYPYKIQEEQLGTGHAVKILSEDLKTYDGPVMVVYGDMPLFKKKTYEQLMENHLDNNRQCTVLTAVHEGTLDYGRVVRENKSFRVVEQKDCNPEQLSIQEFNVGVYVFNSNHLFQTLSRLKNNNVQNEYYLTDVPEMMQAEGLSVGTYTIHKSDDIFGVNTLDDLQFVESVIRGRG